MVEPLALGMSGVGFGYPRFATFLGPIDLELPVGRMLAVVGPNGAGKSTLLRLMAGLYAPRAGSITVAGRPVGSLSSRDRARMVAFLPQHAEVPSALSARQVVLLGRFPHRRYRFFDSPDDHRITEQVMRTTATDQFADRTLGTISAGERQRVHLAAALAQQPRLLVLDEPTSALDPYHQISMFAMLRRLCRRDGQSVVVVTHDLNLAGQHADFVLLLGEGRVAAQGPPQEVLRPEILEAVYGVAFRVLSSASDTQTWVVPVPHATPESP